MRRRNRCKQQTAHRRLGGSHEQNSCQGDPHTASAGWANMSATMDRSLLWTHPGRTDGTRRSCQGSRVTRGDTPSHTRLGLSSPSPEEVSMLNNINYNQYILSEPQVTIRPVSPQTATPLYLLRRADEARCQHAAMRIVVSHGHSIL